MDNTIDEALKTLAFDVNLYYAASPGYKRNFSRDSFIYGLLAGDIQSLLAQVDYSAMHQGRVPNPATGEELGKIHHEYPGGQWRGRPTDYNACDTNALYLIAIARLAGRGYDKILRKYRESINSAIGYILNHLHDGLFYEDPGQSGAKNFAVRVTYWKDSVLNAAHKEPKYPIVYSLVHFQSATALQEIGRVLGAKDLVHQAMSMKKAGMKKLWSHDHFVTAIDEGNYVIDAPSSDSLHSLLYFEPDEIGSEYAAAISDYSKQLETPAGFMPSIVMSDNLDVYHTRYLWIFEQALLHAASQKHSLTYPASVAARVVGFMGSDFPELLDSENDFVYAGNRIQLWTIGACRYFQDSKSSLL